jgi:dipeptidyl aminopeptidase/acylaminoacyl peptidase
MNNMLELKKYDVDPLIPGAPVSSPAISPDGKLIVFVRTVVDHENDNYESHLWTVSTDGGDPTQITQCDGNDITPIWAPDGKTIYFISNRAVNGDKKNRLWSFPINGGESRLVLEQGNIMNASLSKDGSKLLYLARTEEESETPTEKMDEVMWVTKLRYKMDGQGYYPYTRPHVFIADLSSGKVKQITKGPYDVSSPSWSPDNKKIAYLADPANGDYSRMRDIYIKPLEEEAYKVTASDSLIFSVDWSPKGDRLVYTGRKPTDLEYPHYANTDIFIISSEGGDPRNITKNLDRTVGAYGASVEWVNENYIFFRVPDHGSYHIYKVEVDTSKVSPLTEGNMNITSFSLSEDASKIAYDSSDATWPREIFVLCESSKRLTYMTGPIMKKWVISTPEEFWFTASDGVEVQGWIVKPNDYKIGEKYPFILEIHGGPHGAYGFNLATAEHEFQMLARNGYAVAYFNPRDSIGYGEEFGAIAEGSWGERDWYDLMEGVDHVLANYDYVDKNRMGVAGGSFGGFMTNWTIGHTDRFKAAVTMRSVCNWFSQVGYSDVSWGYSGIGNYREPWEIPEKYLKHSPITYADKMTTPLLIIHSEFDHRCPLPEGEQLYYTLKRLKREVEYIRFANNSHGLSRIGKPSHRTARLRHILRWFDKYLK